MTAKAKARIELQIALDRIPLDRAVDITSRVRGLADWIEVGTSLVKQHGMPGVARIVAAAGDTPVLVDLKTADDARTEVLMAAATGARSITVLGLAGPATLTTAIAVAQDHRIEVMIDLMQLDAAGRARVAAATPAGAVLAAHVPKDAQTEHTDATALLGDWTTGRRLALAGGLGLDDVPALARWGDVRLIVGSAVTASTDPVAAARAFRAAITASHDPSHRPKESPMTTTRIDQLDTVLAEIHGVATRIDRTQLDALASALLAAERIFVTGEGRSGFMSRAFAMRLMHLGLPVFVIGETTTPAVRGGDIVVAVSGSGSTGGTVRVAQQATALGATVWAVTTDPTSALGSTATAHLVIPAATKYRRPDEAPTIQPLSSLYDQATHISLDVVCLIIAAARGVDNARAGAAHANTE
jgi:6-phospho-3-hexuloisomerase